MARKQPAKRSVRLMSEQMEDRLVPAINLSGVEFRTIDGTNNNLANPDQGAAETRNIRFGYGVEFEDADTADVGNVILGPGTTPARPNARTVSNVIHAQSGDVLSDAHLTDWAFQWGQWITHDMDLTRNGSQFNVLLDPVTLRPTGSSGTYSIPILDPNDPLGPRPIPFNRSEIDFDSVNDPSGLSPPRRHQINSITSYIDASMVYGSDEVRQAALRTFQGGRLKTSAGGQLLPLNTAGLPNADESPLPGNQLFLAGDVRANEQLNLTAVHTLFVREHNRLANRIHQLQPHLNDEQIYQLARRLVGAEMQVITYEEYLPAIFGQELAPESEGTYSADVDASVTNSFAHAIFRFGHSQINDRTLLVNNQNQTVGTLSVDDAFFNPNFLKENPNRVGLMLKGLASQNGQEVDLLLVDGIRNNLFGPAGAGGLDLAALDIQRGRDHGLPDYNQLRGAYGVPAVTSFAQISSDTAIQAKLQQLYGNVKNIDAFVGALAEDHLPGASVGPLVHAIVGNQFERLRDGDRFFYTNDAFLNSPEVRQILNLGQVTLSRVIQWNTNISNLQDNVFFDRSVLVFTAPEGGANVSVVAANGKVSIVNNRTGQVLAARSADSVSQVLLIGSDTAHDVFNLFLAGADGGIEDGVIVSGGGSGGDILRLYGSRDRDAFAVSNASFTANTVDPLGNDTTRTVRAQSSSVNGNLIFSGGIEKVRIATLTGNDIVSVEPGLGVDFRQAFWFDPDSEDD